MLQNQIPQVLNWYFTLLITSSLGIFTLKYFFPKVPIYILNLFSKFFGVLIIAYVSWFLFTTFNISYNFYSLSLIFIVLCTLAAYLVFKSKELSKQYLLQFLKQQGPKLLFTEILYISLFALFTLYRATYPEYIAAEDFMNYGFINSLLRGSSNSLFTPKVTDTTFNAPLDIWFSGEAINYYYLGHYYFATITLLSKVSNTIAYNLALVTVITNSILMSVGLAWYLTKKFAYATLSGLFLGFMGSLYLWVVLFKEGIIANEFFKIAVRFIPYTITNFPAFDFFVGGYHAHVFGIQTLLLFIFLVYLFFEAKVYEKLYINQLKYFVLLSLALGFSYASNSWNLVGSFGVFATMYLFFTTYTKESLLKTFSSLASVLVLCFVLYFPYFLTISNGGVGGIGLTFDPSGIVNMFYFFGFLFVLPLIWFLIVSFRSFYPRGRLSNHLSSIFNASSDTNDQPTEVFSDLTQKYIFSLVIVSFVLIFSVELFYLKDILSAWNPLYSRTNTIFKIWYQAWILLSISISYILYNFRLSPRLKFAFITVIILVHSIYSGEVFALRLPYTFDFTMAYEDSREKTLDGTYHLKESAPDIYHAINYLNYNIASSASDRVVMLAPPNLHTYEENKSIYSVNTGHTSVLGWWNHELFWRGSYEAVNERVLDIQTAYTSQDSFEVYSILQKYAVDYVIFNEDVALNYGDRVSNTLIEFIEPIYISETISIYKVLQEDPILQASAH